MNRLLILFGIIFTIILLGLRKIYVDNNKEYQKYRQIPVKIVEKEPEYKKDYTLTAETEQILGEYNHDFYDNKLFENDIGNNYPKNDFNFF
jgi:hypothetical protein